MVRSRKDGEIRQASSVPAKRQRGLLVNKSSSEEFEDFFTTNWNNTPTKPQIQNENKQINKIAPEDIRIDIDSMQPHILLKGVIIVETPCGTQIHSFRNREEKFPKQIYLKRSLGNEISKTNSTDIKKTISSTDIKMLASSYEDDLNQISNKNDQNSLKPPIKDNLRNRFHKIETALKKKASNIKNKQSWTKLNFFTPKKKIDSTMKPISKQHSTTHMVNSNTNQNDLDVSLSFMSHNSKFLPDNYENLIKMLKDLKNSDSDENFNSEKAEMSNSFNCLSSVGPTCLPLDIDKIETLPENKSENYKNNDNYDNYSSHGIWNRIKSIPKLEFIKNKFIIYIYFLFLRF